MKKVKKFFNWFKLNFLVIPPRNDSYKCPRCNSRKWYLAKDGFIQHTNAYGSSWRGDDITSIRCKECNTVMNHYMNPDFLDFKTRWQILGSIIAIPVVIAICLAIADALTNSGY
jgi:phage FluMu protein Com